MRFDFLKTRPDLDKEPAAAYDVIANWAGTISMTMADAFCKAHWKTSLSKFLFELLEE